MSVKNYMIGKVIIRSLLRCSVLGSTSTVEFFVAKRPSEHTIISANRSQIVTYICRTKQNTEQLTTQVFF